MLALLAATPGAPDALSGLTSFTSLMPPPKSTSWLQLRWLAPADNGNAIVSYEIEWQCSSNGGAAYPSGANDAACTDPPLTSVEVAVGSADCTAAQCAFNATGLSPDVAYDFRIRAKDVTDATASPKCRQCQRRPRSARGTTRACS